ncbi:Palmitoyltransferase ZDHHC18-like [Scleropages formosus]|uniref:Palmitoyltransferase n=1 Tax=Scleropages formosus TaxID=113540 RepID=A0A0P7W996_SCLFO|nr:Palmitoyltransferase ZDHHC18-like [Scleropages formosus]
MPAAAAPPRGPAELRRAVGPDDSREDGDEGALNWAETMKNCEYRQIEPQGLGTPNAAPPPPAGANDADTRAKRRRKWEVFPGKNRFYCDGRIMVARQSGVLPLTLGLIVLTSCLFFVFDCPFLVEHVTSCIPAIGGALFAFVIISLLQTSFRDPGILPRATADEAAYTEKQIDDSASSSYRPPPRTLEVIINQQVVKLKYCFTCKMFRPPRTSHCSLCDNCVERFDHHCPWVGNCVGKRNYRFFYAFIVSLSFLTAFIFGCVTTHLTLRSQGGKGLITAVQESPARYPFTAAVLLLLWVLESLCQRGNSQAFARTEPLTLWSLVQFLTCWTASMCKDAKMWILNKPSCTALELIVCFFSVWSILGLSGFHTYLVASNLTTNEDIKGSWSGNSGVQNTVNPYSYNNIFANCCAVLCAPLPPRRGFLPTQESPPAAQPQVELPVFVGKSDLTVCGGQHELRWRPHCSCALAPLEQHGGAPNRSRPVLTMAISTQPIPSICCCPRHASAFAPRSRFGPHPHPRITDSGGLRCAELYRSSMVVSVSPARDHRERCGPARSVLSCTSVCRSLEPYLLAGAVPPHQWTQLSSQDLSLQQ